MSLSSQPDDDQKVTGLPAGAPRRLGAYGLIGRLGRGGMGTVFLGERPDGHRVAIKVINAELAQEESFRERFRREVTAARRVRPFCTAPVLDADLSGDPLYVVTEFVDGPTLDEAVRDGGPLTGSNLEGIAVGIATALTAIHSAGVVHRDLKPSNVLLSSYGPRVIDFGIARALDSVEQLTRTGHLVGTPGYMPPESLNGGEIGPAADVFCWGCVVGFAATGRPPYSGRTLQEILYKVAHEPPALDGMTGPLRVLVEQATAKDPMARPTAQDLVDRLTGRSAAPTVADQVPPAARPTLPWPGAGSGAAEPTAGGSGGGGTARGRVIAGAVIALGVLATAAYLMPGSKDDPRSGVPASGTPAPSKSVPAGSANRAAPAIAGVDLALRQTIVTDDFADPKSGWLELPDRLGYHDGFYEIEESTNANVAHSPGLPRLPENIGLDVKAKFDDKEYLPDSEAGVFCREQYNGDKYTFGVRPDGYALVHRYGDRSKELGRSAGPVGTPGVFNRLQATCTNESGKIRLRFWVDGRPAVDVVDADAPLGNDPGPTGDATGLYVFNPDATQGRTRAAFDDFRLGTL